MPKEFKLSYTVPPTRQFFYQVPGGPYVETACDWGMLESEVRRRCEAAGVVPPEPLRALMEDYMCDHLPPGFCTGGEPSKPMISFSAVLESTDKIVKRASATGGFGRSLADRIDSRANACMACKSHSMGLCLTCNGLLAHYAPYLRDRQTAYDRTLRVCTATMAAVPLLLHVDAAAMPDAAYPEGCWVSKERGHV